MDKLVQRFDFGGFRSPPVRTPQGFLQIKGTLTRTGVLTYARKDGSKVREYRPPEEVFKPVSLDGLSSVPVTDLHPSEMVSPGNVRSLQRGRVAGAREDGRFVTGIVEVQDQQLIQAVESGERRELSPGYNCRIDATSGTTPQGEAFDVIQRGIVYNHMALGPAGWARSGSEVALHMDDAEADQLVLRLDQTTLGLFVRDALSLKGVTERDLAKATSTDEFTLAAMLDGFFGGPVTEKDLAPIANFLKEETSTLFALVPLADRGDGKTTHRRKKTMDPKEIRIDGISYKVDESAAPHIDKAISDRDAKISTESARADTAEAKIVDLAKERDTEKARADAASNPETISKMVKKRAALEIKAHAILGAEAKLDGSDQEIKIAAIKHTDSAFEAEGQTVDYIDARFDMLDVKEAKEGSKDAAARALAATRVDGKGGSTETKTDSNEAKNKSEGAAQDAWKTPLNSSKDVAPVAKA